MSDTPFPPEMRRALDGFAPPPLPADFADRLAAKAQTRTPPTPRLSRRWRSASPWRRAGLIVSGVASLSLVSAAAAATGVFGEPVQVPVISRIAQSLEIVPRPVVRAAREIEEARPVLQAAAVIPVRERLDAVLDAPEFRALPPLERRTELRRRARELIDSGEATPREVVAALRDTTRARIAALPPERRQRLEETFEQRREAIRERAAALPPAQRRRIEATVERREELGLPPPQPGEVRRLIARERLQQLRLREARQFGREQVGAPTSAPRPAEVTVETPASEGSGAEVR